MEISKRNNGVTFRWIAGGLAAVCMAFFSAAAGCLTYAAREQWQAVGAIRVDVAHLSAQTLILKDWINATEARQDTWNLRAEEKLDALLLMKANELSPCWSE